jgi:hypothetical protein
MSFTYIQGTSNFAGTSTSVGATLSVNPTPGNLLCVSVGNVSASTISNLIIFDDHDNVYAVTPSSPSPYTASTLQVSLGYLLAAPSNASQNIFAKWTTSSTNSFIWINEFSSTGGVVFDTDAASSSLVTGTNINTPVITPRQANELLYACAVAGGSITAPTNGGTLGVWTGAQAGATGGNMAEFDLSASSPTAVQFTQSGNLLWSAMAMAFYQNTNPASVFMLAQVGPHS